MTPDEIALQLAIAVIASTPRTLDTDEQLAVRAGNMFVAIRSHIANRDVETRPAMPARPDRPPGV